MNVLLIQNWRAQDFAAGVAVLGRGIACPFQVNPVAGAYAGIAIAVNALPTNMIVTALVRWVLKN